jgi:hypothetical protein
MDSEQTNERLKEELITKSYANNISEVLANTLMHTSKAEIKLEFYETQHT